MNWSGIIDVARPLDLTHTSLYLTHMRFVFCGPDLTPCFLSRAGWNRMLYLMWLPYLKSYWSYHVHNMCFNNSRKQFLFLTSDALFNRYRNLTGLGSMSRGPYIMAIFIPALVDKKLFNILKWWCDQWRHECVVHNMDNYISPHIYQQTIFVWYHFILFKSSGQTSWQTNTQTYMAQTSCPIHGW